MGDSQLFDFIWKFVLDIVFALGVLPAAGGAVLWKTFQVARIPKFTYGQCWKAYLAGCAYACLLFVMVNIVMGRPAEGMEIVQILIFLVTPFVVVPLILRDFSRRALLVEAIALIVVDVAIVLFVLLSRLH